MQIVRDYQYVRPQDRGASAAIGNFDGVHLGHQHVLDLARRDAPLGVVTFEPHPREYFAPYAPPFRLMNAEARAHRLEKLGVDLLAELPFDAGLSSLSAEAFARDRGLEFMPEEWFQTELRQQQLEQIQARDSAQAGSGAANRAAAKAIVRIPPV